MKNPRQSVIPERGSQMEEPGRHERPLSQPWSGANRLSDGHLLAAAPRCSPGEGESAEPPVKKETDDRRVRRLTCIACMSLSDYQNPFKLVAGSADRAGQPCVGTLWNLMIPLEKLHNCGGVGGGRTRDRLR